MSAKIAIVYFDAGGGHRNAANALCDLIRQQHRPWDVRLVHLQEVLDPADLVRRLTGVRTQDAYNFVLGKGWTLGSPQILPLLHGLIRLAEPRMARILEAYWRAEAPDMVVSVVPNLNRTLARSLRRARPQAPFVTLLTDIADYPPHFWIERESQYLICGSELAARQATHYGHSGRAFRTSGMILHPRFYQPQTLDRASERERLGLDAKMPTGLVLFGGQGSKAMHVIAEQVERCARPCQFIYLCGHNRDLQHELQNLSGARRRHVVGFTANVPHYMALADFFIGKPGPGSVSEAVFMRLPVIVECNAWTLPQERYNAEWIRTQDMGFVLRSFRRQVRETVDRMLEPGTLDKLRRNTELVKNTAIFEAADLLASILEKHAAGSNSSGAQPRMQPDLHREFTNR